MRSCQHHNTPFSTFGCCLQTILNPRLTFPYQQELGYHLYPACPITWLCSGNYNYSDPASQNIRRAQSLFVWFREGCAFQAHREKDEWQQWRRRVGSAIGLGSGWILSVRAFFSPPPPTPLFLLLLEIKSCKVALIILCNPGWPQTSSNPPVSAILSPWGFFLWVTIKNPA